MGDISASKDKYKVEYANLDFCRTGKRLLVLHTERSLDGDDKNINKSKLLSTSEKIKAVEKVHTIYDDILEKIKIFANRFSKYNYSARYWEIILGKIIIGQISNIYERVLILKKLNKKVRRVSIDCVSDDSYCTPNKTIYHRNLSSQWLVAQYYSQASLVCDIESRYKDVSYSLDENDKSNSNRQNFVKKYLKDISHRLLQGAKVGLRGAQFKNIDIIKIAACTGLNVKRLREVEESVKYEEIKLNKRKRQTVKTLFDENKLYSCILKALSYNIPKLLLEGHERRVGKLHKKINISALPKNIICGRTSYAPFLLLKAEAIKEEKKIFSIQHGGAYGETNSSAEKHERSVSDQFITWGWKKKRKDLPMPAPKMMSYKNSNYNKNKKVLWITRSLSHYTNDMTYETLYKQLTIMEPNEFLSLQTKFFGNLSEESQNEICIRFKSNIRKKGKLREEWAHKVNRISSTSSLPQKVRLEEPSSNMIDQAKKYGLKVVDHFASTSFLQFIALDMPVLIVANIDFRSISDIAKSHYRDLENVGVFHRTPKSAAKKVDKVRHDVENWWETEKRQKVIRNFRNKFAWKPDYSYRRWCEMINEL